jgi:hypothetical protein
MAFALRMIARQPGFQLLRQPHLAQGANSAWLIQPFQVDILPDSKR